LGDHRHSRLHPRPQRGGQRDDGGGVAGIHVPSTPEPVDDASGRGFPRSDVKNRPPGSHQAIGLAGDDGAEGRRFLGDEADVASPEGLGEFVARPIAGKLDVGVPTAEGFEGFAPRAGSGEGEVETAIGAEVVDCRAERIHVVSEAEIAGIEDTQRAGRGDAHCRI